MDDVSERKTYPDVTFFFSNSPAPHGTGQTLSHIKFRQEVDVGLADRQKNYFLGKYSYSQNRSLRTH